MVGCAKYTAEQIQTAGMLFYQNRNIAQTARECGIPKLSLYKYEREGDENWEKGKRREATIVDKRLSRRFLEVTERAVDFLIENFDDPEKRKKLQPRDVSWMGVTYHDKRQILEGKPTTISASSKAAEARLKELSEVLLKGKPEPVKLFDVKKNVS